MSASARRAAPPQPSSRHRPASPFAWDAAPPDAAARAAGHARRVEAARAELASRAGLLYRLGYAEADAVARLSARTAWELAPAGSAAPHRRPDALSDAEIARLVADTYARRPG